MKSEEFFRKMLVSQNGNELCIFCNRPLVYVYGKHNSRDRLYRAGFKCSEGHQTLVQEYDLK